MDSRSPVTRDDLGQLTAVSAPEDIPAPRRRWSDEDWLRIRRGHKPADLDDRWDDYVEGARLYLRRSWTGNGIYEAQFVHASDGWHISCAVVEGDRGKYRRGDGAFESSMLEAVIDGTLGRAADGPEPDA